MLGPLIGTILTAPIIDGGRNRANLERTEAALRESVALYRQQVLVAFAEVEDNLIALRTLDGQAQSTQESLVSPRARAQIADVRYNAGRDELSRRDRGAAHAARGSAPRHADPGRARELDRRTHPRARRRVGRAHGAVR